MADVPSSAGSSSNKDVPSSAGSSNNSSSDRNGIVCPNIVEHACSYLTRVKKFRYNANVHPNVNDWPRPAIEVWRDIVCLFDASKERSLVVLTDDLTTVFENSYDNEVSFNKALHGALRTELENAALIDACKASACKTSACETSEKKKERKEPIVFTSKQHKGFAIAIVREVNGEQRDVGIRAPVATNDGTRGSESGLVANATIDHGVCLLRKDKKDEWKMAHCLCAIELKLVGSKNQCEAIPHWATGENPGRWLQLGYSHGAISQVMFYTIGWVVPSLAKLGQLGKTIPWAVVVGKRNTSTATESGVGSEDKEQLVDPPEEANEVPSVARASKGRSKDTEAQAIRVTTPKIPNKTKGNASAAARAKTGDAQESGLPQPPRTRKAPQGKHVQPAKASGRPPRPLPSPLVTTNEDETLSITNEDETATSAPSKFNHWVTGNIYVPPACGDCYEYTVTGFEWLPTDPNDTSSAENALSVYLETLLFGLLAGVRWLDELSKNRLCQAVATSGTDLMIGIKKLDNLRLVGRAGRFAVLDAESAKVEDRKTSGEWIISQGEIFRGSLNIQQLTEEVNLVASQYLLFNTGITDVEVAVKVSSVAVHKYLTHPDHAWKAIHEIYNHIGGIAFVEGANRELESAEEIYMLRLEKQLQMLTVTAPDEKVKDANRRVEEAQQTVTKAHENLAMAKKNLEKAKQKYPKLTKPPEISDVLLAVHFKAAGLVTIMKDLSVYNFMDLRPSSCTESLPVLWEAFLKLLEDVLIPMANLGIIHPDMRPGFDETSNIMYTIEVKGSKEKASMKLIDYESLSLISDWSVPDGAKEALYVHGDGDAHACLWKQSLAICYAWKTEKTQTDMLDFKLDEVERDLQNSDEQNSWLRQFYNINGDRRMTEDLVPHLKDLFAMNSEGVPTVLENLEGRTGMVLRSRPFQKKD